MIDDPLKMLRGLVILAPELNLRVAFLNLVDYIDDVVMDIPDEGEQEVLRVEDILNIVAESLVKLHHHVYDEFSVGGETYDRNEKTEEEQVNEFRRILGLIPEKDDNKEENNE